MAKENFDVRIVTRPNDLGDDRALEDLNRTAGALGWGTIERVSDDPNGHSVYEGSLVNADLNTLRGALQNARFVPDVNVELLIRQEGQEEFKSVRRRAVPIYLGRRQKN